MSNLIILCSRLPEDHVYVDEAQKISDKEGRGRCTSVFL